MKTLLLLFLAVLLACSCNHTKTSDIVCVCYIFDPDNSLANTYIEIHKDGFIEATEGLCTDTIDHIIYDNGELYPNKNLFISSKEYPDSEYDESCRRWIFHTYNRPTVKNSILSKKQMANLNYRINDFIKLKKKSKDYNRSINKDNIDWDSYGIILMMEGETFKYWEKSGTQEEEDFLNFIKKISPLVIKPKIPQKNCF